MFDSNSAKNLTGPQCLFDGEVSGIGNPGAQIELRVASGTDHLTPGQSEAKAKTLIEAMQLVMDTVCTPGVPGVHAVGYRVVHPGAKLREHQRITPEVLHDLEKAEVFAPLHDPAVIAVIRKGMKQFPNAAHYACFDTVFHQTMPEEANTYAVPQAFRAKGVRRYGFHGLSCESIVRQMRANEIGCPKRVAIAHLGSGCSVTALVNGCSVDTTMGLTPTGGVVMGTRPGDLDPGVVLYLLRQQQKDGAGAISAVETILNHESGMIALTGMSNDVKALRRVATEGDALALLALKVFTRSITKAIGAFCWLLGGLDAIVFAGGIGEHDALTRLEILTGLEGIGDFN